MILFSNRTIKLIFTATLTIILAANAVSVMLFSGLGKTAANSGYNYVLTLHIFLAAIGITYYLSTINLTKSNWFYLISTLLSGGLLGFYLGGVASDKNPQVAIISAIALSIMFGISFWQKYQFLSVAIAFIATIAAYGFAFFAGTQSLSLFSVSIISPGIAWSLVCFIYIALTINNVTRGINIIKSNKS